MKIDYDYVAELCEVQIYDTVTVIISINVRGCHEVGYRSGNSSYCIIQLHHHYAA